ncbi:MAG: pyridoxamine 5'-phosphate oxidase family protein [Gemmatimonadaceae bacterium]
MLLACSDGSKSGSDGSRKALSAPTSSVPFDELYKVASDSAILSAARALMLADSNVAVVTLDSMGQPRVRTTKAFVSAESPGDPAKGVTVWIMTRLTTRKVDQMRRHPQVTLYFNNDDRVEYATVMGTAIIHTDATNPEAMKFYEDGYAEFFWPDFPRDFVMIEVRPRWLEYLGPDIAAHPQTWRPQAVVFDSVASAR